MSRLGALAAAEPPVATAVVVQPAPVSNVNAAPMVSATAEGASAVQYRIEGASAPQAVNRDLLPQVWIEAEIVGYKGEAMTHKYLLGNGMLACRRRWWMQNKQGPEQGAVQGSQRGSQRMLPGR